MSIRVFTCIYTCLCKCEPNLTIFNLLTIRICGSVRNIKFMNGAFFMYRYIQSAINDIYRQAAIDVILGIINTELLPIGSNGINEDDDVGNSAVKPLSATGDWREGIGSASRLAKNLIFS